ncbi:MAG: DUF6356 family protein [Kiloniellales bacterium]
MVKRLFTDHPASVGETYSEHLVMAAGFGWRLVFAGLACFAHALLPFLFERTGSRTIAELHDSMVIKRSRRPAAPVAARRPVNALR